MRQGQVLASVMMLLSSALLSGCGSSSTPMPVEMPPTYQPPVGNYVGAAFSGRVMAGALPVIGATVQLYTAGATGNGSAPTQLLATGLMTDATGAFSVAAGYTCALSTSVLYVVASGGRAGAAGAGNSGTVLMSSPGACTAVMTGASYVLNEVTTVASAYAFARFLKAGAQLGASSSNTSGLTLAAGTLANLVSVSNGTAPGAGFPATGVAPAAKIYTLADALNACVVSSGAGSSACSGLYSASVLSGTPPTNTLDAALSIALHPGVSAGGIYTLSTASTVYAGLGAAPADWTMYATYGGGGMSGPASVALDSQGRVWVSSVNGVASLFSNTGVPVFAAGITGKGLQSSYGAAVDASDHVWITNQQGGNNNLGSVTVLDGTGALVAGSPYLLGGLDFPTAVSFDTTGVAWVANFGDASVTLLSATGVPLSGTYGYFAGGSLSFPTAVAVDSKRNGWVTNQSSNTVTKLAPDGSYTNYVCCSVASGVAIDGVDNVWVTNFSTSAVVLISSGTILGGSGFTGGGLNRPQGIAIDGNGGVWVANYGGPGITQLKGVNTGTAGAAVSPASGWAPDAGEVQAYAIAVDASGNLWVSSYYNNTLTEYVGMAVPVKTPLVGPVRVP